MSAHLKSVKVTSDRVGAKWAFTWDDFYLAAAANVGWAQCSPSGGCQILYANSKPSSDVSRPGVKLVQRGPQFQCLHKGP